MWLSLKQNQSAATLVAHVTPFLLTVHTAGRNCMLNTLTSSVQVVVGAIVVAISFTKLLSNQLPST
ncbi:MAG: hypothetical protein RI890_340 [Actinomycetota bacterium]